jgi:hypothetical protein
VRAISPLLAPTTAPSDHLKLYDYDAAAELLCMTAVALRNRVYRGEGPVPTTIGRRIFFAAKDIAAYIDAHRRPPNPPQTTTLAEALTPKKRRRGRPTVAEAMARKAAANRGEA